MKNKSRKSIVYFLLALTSIGLFALLYCNKQAPTANSQKNNFVSVATTDTTIDISSLTQEDSVIAYLKLHQQLPDFYITKKAASAMGWSPSAGNLCDVLPGHAIGGDYFSNREGKLPKVKSRKYYEADVNYNCGRRNADRIVYSNDGLIFLTKDHYNIFQEK